MAAEESGEWHNFIWPHSGLIRSIICPQRPQVGPISGH